MKLQACQLNGGTLPEFRGKTVLVKLQQFRVNIHFKTHMAAVVTAVFFCKICFPVDVRMAVSVQNIMSQKSSDVCVSNLHFCWIIKQTAAF